MAVKKSSLYSKLWDSCNTLRSKGGMDATQYKDYVLIVLFMKVITDKYYKKTDSLIEVPEDANFNTMIDLKGKKNIGEEFNRILATIAEKNDLQNVIDIVDFDDENKLGQGKDLIEALTGLVEIFQDPELDFSNNRADDDDILGDAYEYLMKQFASEAGKSKGQFYTPSEVSRVMSKLLKINETTEKKIYIYDMTCGSGSLLLKTGAEAKENVKTYLYGQEKDTNTAGLAVMNMVLHGIQTATIKVGNTLTNPQFLTKGELRTFDYCVANPPFSVKKWSTDLTNDYDRFTDYGIPPENCADYAFLLHMLKSMDKKNGRGAIILPHGVLFRGGQEEKIRKLLVKKGIIEGIIGLPPNLFYGTGIAACIIILDNKGAKNRKDIFMLETSKYFIKEGSKNKLREEEIKKITDIYLNRIEEDKYSRIISIKEIEQEGYNLNISRYINSKEEERKQDIKAHLFGGIPEKDIDKYNKYWNFAPNLKKALFKNNQKEGYLDLIIPKDSISETIKNSKEIILYKTRLQEKVNEWSTNSKTILEKINSNTRVKELIEILSNELLKTFQDDNLINKYDAYEYLMEYYNEIMKDDFHLIVGNGWRPQLTYGKDKNGKIKRMEFDSDLLPKTIIINTYFQNEAEKIKQLENTINELQVDFELTIEENATEEFLWNEEKLTSKIIKEMLLEEDEEANRKILEKILNNLNSQKEIKKKIKEYQERLNTLIIEKYNSLDENTSKDLIINKKWFYTIKNKFICNLEEMIYRFSNNIIVELENYEETLDNLTKITYDLESKVLIDLKRMGYK